MAFHLRTRVGILTVLAVLAGAAWVQADNDKDKDKKDKILSIDHCVPHTSTVYSLAGQPVTLFVRERVKHGKAKDHKWKNEGRVVLFIHGASVASEAVFDPPIEGYSVLESLAEAGIDAFAMDLTTFGRSTRPALMDDKCNAPLNAEPFIGLRTCGTDALSQPTMPYPFVVRSTATDMSDVDRVVEYLREIRGVDRVHLVGYSDGGRTAGRYAIEHPEKINRLVLVAPTYVPTSITVAPAVLPRPVATNPTTGRRQPTAGSVQGTLKSVFISNWNSQISPDCEGQLEPGIQDTVWNVIQATDPVGATWGDGVLRFTLTAFWGWNQTTVTEVQAPTLLISGLLDNDNPNAVAAALFNDMTVESRVFLSLECTGHLLFYEKQRRVVADAIGQWLLEGELEGLTCGTARAEEDGTIVPTGECAR